MRHLFKYASVFVVLLAVTACGFHLRGTQKTLHQVKTVAIQPDNPTEFFQRIFRRYLRDIDVNVEPASADKYVIRLQPEHYVREVLIIGTDALAKQESMIYTINFEILSPYEGALGQQSVQVTRMLNLDPSRILGQNQEESIMLAEMREEASMQIYYRLNVIAEREQREHLVNTHPVSSEEEKEQAKGMETLEKTQAARQQPAEMQEIDEVDEEQ
ncbi:MAG: LPS assembly lipoprotein LptE [Gammaproteobacteria bacterium]